MITTVLFDLDGTLLPMDQDEFIKAYMGALAKKLVPYGYNREKLLECLGKGIWAMVANDGRATNEKVFWQCFEDAFGDEVDSAVKILDEFYEGEFDEVSKACGVNPRSAELIKNLKNKGYRIALATNPLFPQVATRARVRWAGMDFEDFEYVTTYENISFCKPNLKYYESVLETLGVTADECVMIGNDAEEDMAAAELGMKTFLLTDCIVNRKELDISIWPQGGFDELEKFIEEM